MSIKFLQGRCRLVSLHRLYYSLRALALYLLIANDSVDASVRSAAEQQLSQAAEADFVSYPILSYVDPVLSNVLISTFLLAGLPYHTLQ